MAKSLLRVDGDEPHSYIIFLLHWTTSESLPEAYIASKHIDKWTYIGSMKNLRE